MKKSLFNNAIYKAILSFVNIVVPLLVGPYITKLLNVELYGIYNTVYAEFQVFLIFASFGLYTYGMREISKIRNDKNKVSKLFTNLFIISILSNLIISSIYFIYIRTTSSGITFLLYFIMMIQFVGNTFYIEFLNEALENYKFITVKTLIIKILYLISIFLFVKKASDVAMYAIIVSLVIFANNIVSFIYAKKYIKFDFKNIKLKRYIIPLLTILIIENTDLLYSQLDRIMLGKFVNGVAVSMYYIPYYIVSTLSAIPYSLINVSIPRMAYLVANEGKEAYLESLNKVISSFLFMILPMCFGILVLAYEVIYLYAGTKYMACVSVLVVSCIIRIFLSVGGMLTHLVMYPNNQEKKLLIFSFAGGMINLGLNSLLVYFKVLNPLNAMLTTLVAEIAIIVMMLIYVKRKCDFIPKIISRQNLIYLGLSLMFIPISMLIKWIDFGFYYNIMVIIVLCVSLYGGVLLLMKDENIQLIKDKIFKMLKFKKQEVK